VQTTWPLTAGCEDAWAFFGGVFAVVVPDNMSPVVADADAVNPRLTREWLEYAQARGFVTDPARVRHPRAWLPQLAGYLVRIPARTGRPGCGPGPLRCMIHRYMHWRNQYW